jgi:hypothetical protein
MKINEVEITKVSYSDLEQSTLFQECRDMAPKLNRQWRTLNEGKALNTGEIHDLFTGVEQTMTSGNMNKTLIGKGADAFGWLGGKIDSVKQALKDTTPVQGLDAAFADLKQTAAGKLEKTPGGSAVLRTIDRYQQFAKKYPKTQKALWNSAAIIGGLLSGGAAVPLILGTAKTLDSMVLGNELSTSIGAGVGQLGKTAAVAGATAGVDAIANADIPDFGPDNVPGPDDVTPNASQEFPLQNDPNAPDTGPTDNPPKPDNVAPPVKPAPVKPAPVKPTPDVPATDAPATDVDPTIDPYNPATDPTLQPGGGETGGDSDVPNVNSTDYLDAAKRNIVSQNTADVTTGADAPDTSAIDDRGARAMASKSAPTTPPDYSMGVKGMDQSMNAYGSNYNTAVNAAKALGAGGGKIAMETNAWSAGKKISEQRLIESSIAAIGFKFTRLPKSVMIDKDDTVRHWALKESLGRTRSQSVRLTEDGVNAIFYNIDKLHGHVLKEAANNRPESQTPEAEAKRQARALARGEGPVATDGRVPGTVMTTNMDRTQDDLQRDQEGGRVYNSPADGNDAVARAKQGNPANTSSTAGPLGGLPKGNVGGLATGTAPAGNKIDYLAADPKGVYDTKYKGSVGGKTMDTIEKGVGRAGNYLSGLFKSATTKFEAERAKRRWKDANVGNDSDAIAEFLQQQKVPPEIITQVYQQLGLPAPKGQGQEAGGDWTNAAANPWTRGIAKGLGATDTVAAIDAGERSNIGKGGKEKAGADGTTSQAGSEESTGAEDLAQQSGGSARDQKVARSIDNDIDDLIRNLRKTDNMLQPAYIKYIRDRLDQTFGGIAPAAAPVTAAAETPAAAAPAATSAAEPAAAKDDYSKGQLSATPTSVTRTSSTKTKTAEPEVTTESASVKFTRKFATFLDNQG